MTKFPDISLTFVKWPKFPDIFSKFPDNSLTWRKFCFSLTFPWHVATLMIGAKRSHLHHLVPTTTAKVICSCRCYVTNIRDVWMQQVHPKCFGNFIVKGKVTFSSILIKNNQFYFHMLSQGKTQWEEYAEKHFLCKINSWWLQCIKGIKFISITTAWNVVLSATNNHPESLISAFISMANAQGPPISVW